MLWELYILLVPNDTFEAITFRQYALNHNEGITIQCGQNRLVFPPQTSIDVTSGTATNHLWPVLVLVMVESCEVLFYSI